MWVKIGYADEIKIHISRDNNFNAIFLGNRQAETRKKTLGFFLVTEKNLRVSCHDGLVDERIVALHVLLIFQS